MRIAAALLLILMAGTAQAESANPAAGKPAAAKPAQPAPAAAKPKPKRTVAKPVAIPPATQAQRDAYAAMPLNERLAIQSDLIWSGDYNGAATGDFNDRAIAAVRTYQRRSKAKETGILTPQERSALAAAVKEKQEQVGWRLVADRTTGARLGIPAKLAPHPGQGKSGSRWTSKRNEIQIETFRERLPTTTLAAVFEREKTMPTGRKVDYNVIRPDFFVVSGLQGLKKFYVRGHVRDNEVRGVTILYDQAMDGIMEPVVIAMSSAYLAFPAEEGIPPPKRKVEYATGIVVNRDGAIVASKRALDECQVIVVPGHGGAERVAADETSDLALIRLYGARDLTDLPLAAGAPKSADLTLVGIGDPQTQDGGAAVSIAAARLGAVSGGAVMLDPSPGPGFAGAAAIDRDGQFVGSVELKPQVVAGPAQGGTQAALIPAAKIRSFLDAKGVAAATGAASSERARNAVVRVICVRK
jgi:peptidoglycan hydrolase-like protein with peptidoglycan-binding domain